MSVSVTIKVRKEVVKLAEKMVKYSIARSRSHAINLMIEYGLEKIIEEVRFWEKIHEDVDELKKRKIQY